MDTLSHAVIGLAVGSLSGHAPDFHDPIYIAVLLGAQAPDFDIITNLKSRLTYLRQHRGFSHSLPGLILWSSLISITLQCFSTMSNIVSLFSWAFVGGLSHIFMDFFNTHGAAVLWPFNKFRKSFPLLNVFDPILLTLTTTAYILDTSIHLPSLSAFTTIILYIVLRVYWRHQATIKLRACFFQNQISRIIVMPSLKSIFHWDYVIETSSHHLVGRISLLSSTIDIVAELPKQELSPSTLVALKATTVGNFFNTFTPCVYIDEQQNNNTTQVNFYDLRYIFNKQFIHTATLSLGIDKTPFSSHILSYGHKIKIPC